MKRFLLLYNGPPPTPPVTHEGWPEWSESIGDALVDIRPPSLLWRCSAVPADVGQFAGT